MADKTISQLTAAATPLAGTEVLPIVQSGTTVKVSIANVTAGRAVSATSIAAGLGAVGTPSYTFTGDLNTGMWSPAADTVAFSTNGTERARIDNSGNVGIGTSSPTNKLDVNGTAAASGYLINGSSHLIYSGSSTEIAFRIGASGPYYGIGTTGSDNMRINSGSGGDMLFSVIGNEYMRINYLGNVGIGTPSPSFQLQLSTDSAAKPTTNLWTIASDSRIKTETGEYTKGLDAVCALRPVTYRYNGTAGFVDDGKENISIIAQEAAEHFPECVGTFEVLLNADDEEKTELFNWNGHALIFALVNAVKELKAMNEALAARLSQIEGV